VDLVGEETPVHFRSSVSGEVANPCVLSTREKAKQTWQSPERAAAYRVSRDPSRFTRYEREERIVTQWLADLPARAMVLDLPCGTGRFIPLLTAKGFRYVGGDFSQAMIQEARGTAGQTPTVGFVNADVEFIPFRDRSVDCVIIWRFLHHIDKPSVRQAMLREAARVTRRKVLVSFYHPFSFTHWRKLFQRRFFGKPGANAVSHGQLRAEAAACGLRMVETKGFRKYVSVNWFASFEKFGTTGQP
jgi:ubiquinone/menaquinone biosynthesis C-methylase UbiE